jgi:hypothetical protein
MTLEATNLDTPDITQTFEHVELRLVDLPGATIGRAVLQRGWRWSTDVGPVVGAPSCPGHHIAYIVSGRFRVRMDDGRELELGPGDARVVGPGHDACVVGDEPFADR